MATKDTGIKRLGKNLYRIRFEGPAKPDGSRGQVSMTIRGTREDARRERATQIARARGIHAGITYGELWDAFVEPSFVKYELKAKTIDGYTRVWNKELKGRISRKRVIDTTPSYVEDVLANIESAWVQRAAHALWRKMINQARHEGLSMANPVDQYIVRKKAVAAPRPTLESKDVMVWLNTIADYRHRAAPLAMAGGGMRVEEASVLIAEDIRPVRHRGKLYAVVNIRNTLVSTSWGKVLQDSTKTPFSERTLWIGEPFATPLLEAIPESGPILPSQTPWQGGELKAKHFIGPTYLTETYREHIKDSGMYYVNPGKLRKSWSNWQGEAGTEDSLVSLQMGHTDGTTRGRNYQSLTRVMSIRMADALEELIREESAFAFAIA